MASINEQIISKLDVVAEYERLGLKIPKGARVRPSGFLSVHAMGREDRNPSACINVNTGWYYDSGGNQESLSLFDFAAAYGNFRDWLEARNHFAGRVGLTTKLPKKDQADRPRDRFKNTENRLPWNIKGRGFLKANPGITARGLELAGAVYGKYPRKSKSAQYCLFLPIYDPEMREVGYVMGRVDGRPVSIYQGKKKAPIKGKTLTIPGSKSGVIGRQGIEKLRDCERVYKVEGVTDLLCLLSLIPDEELEAAAVLSNAFGAGEQQAPETFGPFLAGKTVYVIHDCDQPGQTGAGLWIHHAAAAGADVRNVLLPYEIEEKKGHDLRDYVVDGADWPVIRSLCESAKPVEPAGDDGPDTASAGLKPHEATLSRLRAVVLGKDPDTGTVHLFGQDTFQTTAITRSELRKLQRCDLILALGGHVSGIVSLSGDTDHGMLTMQQVREHIALAAAERPLSEEDTIGAGLYSLQGRSFLVAPRRIVVANGEISEINDPVIANRRVEFPSTEWFDQEALTYNLRDAESLKWCQQQIRDAVSLFRRWDNWKNVNDAELCAALVVATWAQAIWPWRPQVVVTGPSNCGKTMLLTECLPRLFGPIAMDVSRPSAAGLRQAVGPHSRVILIDEFEHDRHRQDILELFRASSRGSTLVRGSADGRRAKKYSLRHIPWVAAIEVGMNRAADRNRCIILEFDAADLSGGKPRLMLPPDDELSTLGQRLLAVAVARHKAAERLYEQLVGQVDLDVDHRIVESYGLPAAILADIFETGLDGARDILAQAIGGRDLVDEQESDEDQLLDAILGTEVWGVGYKMTIGQLLDRQTYELPGDLVPGDELSRVGIARIRAHDGLPDRVFFHPGTLRRYVLKGSDFDGMDPARILLRIPGSERHVHRIGGRQVRGVAIPEGMVSGRIDRTDGYDDGSVF